MRTSKGCWLHDDLGSLGVVEWKTEARNGGQIVRETKVDPNEL